MILPGTVMDADTTAVAGGWCVTIPRDVGERYG
jgi:hypothetical protein